MAGRRGLRGTLTAHRPPGWAMDAKKLPLEGHQLTSMAPQHEPGLGYYSLAEAATLSARFDGSGS